MPYKSGRTNIIIKQGDITEEETDAIVNAANSRLAHGGGVAGAIVRKGGDSIQRESNTIGFVPVGGAASTTAGALKAKRVIHAVGPRMGEGDEDTKLRNATLSSLKTADNEGLRAISFPAISTGIFGYPIERCAPLMLQTVKDYCAGSTSLNEVRFCLYDQDALDVFRRAADKIFGS
jgi:O-acetyl-ADP-ribose deacetylase (regulator of RNase III)